MTDTTSNHALPVTAFPVTQADFSDRTPEYTAALRDVAATILQHVGPLVLLAHENPDGDALGSVLGLARALRELGREVYAPMSLPQYLQFVPEAGELCEPLQILPSGALVVVLDVDSNDSERVAGADLSGWTGPVVNIDHHGTNKRKATALLVDPSQPATTQMVVDVLDMMNIGIGEHIATPLLLGLITDTGSFQFSNTTPHTMRTAARLLEAGARLNWLNDQRMQNPPSYYFLMREVLGTMELAHGGAVVLARVDDAMLAAAGADWEQVDPLVNLLRNAQGARLAVLAKDYGEYVKFSLRSRGGFSAQNVAVALGGGGHVPAAGATAHAPYAEARQMLDRAISAELERLQTEAKAGAEV